MIDLSIRDWEDKAACKATDPNLFFTGENYDRAITEFCNMCPVVAECEKLGQEVANMLGHRWGIWGGVRP